MSLTVTLQKDFLISRRCCAALGAVCGPSMLAQERHRSINKQKPSQGKMIHCISLSSQHLWVLGFSCVFRANFGGTIVHKLKINTVIVPLRVFETLTALVQCNFIVCTQLVHLFITYLSNLLVFS